MLREEGFELTLASRTAREGRGRRRRARRARPSPPTCRREDDCVRVVAEHRERFGGLDVLVNSGGIGIAGTVESLSDEARRPAARRQPARTAARHARGDPAPQASHAAGSSTSRRSPARPPTPGPDRLRRDEGGGDRADALAERRARRRRRARDRALPGLRRHADGRLVGARGGRDDPARGLRRDRARCACASRRARGSRRSWSSASARPTASADRSTVSNAVTAKGEGLPGRGSAVDAAGTLALTIGTSVPAPRWHDVEWPGQL